MKRKFAVAVVCIITITTLLFTGCSNDRKTAESSKGGINSTINKDAKNITDSDLINSAEEDSSTQLESLDTQSQQLSSDEIDSLLDDNNDLNNIPSNFSAK